MAIPEVQRTNFETLQRASDNRDLALLECTDKETGKIVNVIVAVSRDENGDSLMVPLAKMFDGNPFDEVIPPGE